jgi:lactate permease
MPTLMVVMMTRFFGERRSWSEGLGALPFTLFGGLAFTVPYVLTGVFLGPEFPSLVGALAGLAVVTAAARRGFLLPRDRWDFPPDEAWPESWRSRLELPSEGLDPDHDDLRLDPALAAAARHRIPTITAWAPYLLVALLLVLTRLPQLPIGGWLRAVTLEWPRILGTGIAAATAPLYLPGAVLVLVAGLTCFLHRMERPAIRRALADSVGMILGAGFVLVFTVPMVRIYINSGINDAGLSSMPLAMAEYVAGTVGGVWPLFAPVVGALGAFIAGSNTVSNLMFSAFQHGVALRLDLPSMAIVALQAVGAAAGNMVAIHNVVAASATVGLLGREGETLRKTILPTMYYLAAVGILGMAWVYVS